MSAPNVPPQAPAPMPNPPAPAPAPMPPAAAAPSTELPRHHVHHSYIWLESVRTIFIIAVCVVVANFSTIIGLVAEEGMGAEAGFIMAVAGIGTLVVILLTFGIVAGLRVVGYKHLYFTVGPDEFTLCSGIFNKKQVHVPYQRVQSVDQRATLLQRLFGVCTVSIDTAGGAANKAVVVPYVTKAQAEWLRAELYNRKNALAAQAAVASGMAGAASAIATGMAGAGDPIPQSVGAGIAAMAQGAATFAGNVPSPAAAGNVLDVGAEAWNQVGGVFAGPAQDTGRVTYEYGLTNKELFLAGLSNTTSVGLIFAGLVVGVLQIVGFIFDVMGDAADGAVESALVFAGSQASAYLIGVVSAGVIVLVLVLWVLSAVGSCIGYGGFKARRRNNRIEVEYGLLQHTFQGIDIDRVQSVVVKQSFIRRLLGYCELSLGKIDAATGEDSGNKQNTLVNQGIIIHPFVKMNRVPEILAGLVPEFSDLPHEAKPVAKVALRRAVLRQSIWFGGGFWLAVVVTVCLVVFGWVNGEVVTGGIELDSEDLFLLSIGWNVIVVGGYALAAILFVIDVVNAVLWARESSFAYNHRFMQVSNGGLSRETVSFPRQKIQFGCTKSNPLQRRAGTDTLLATTAAGSGGTTTTLIDASHADAMAWLDWLKPGGNQ
ncbi:PH domain-containing protein [Adlercreutzia sp.]|uniref:PH domain-containing protein n=1 Tax=Adlercreutzia sp. TaxID=1872387 RepID=UPI003A93FEA8